MRGMISRRPLGTNICPYGGRRDELLTTTDPRDWLVLLIYAADAGIVERKYRGCNVIVYCPGDPIASGH